MSNTHTHTETDICTRSRYNFYSIFLVRVLDARRWSYISITGPRVRDMARQSPVPSDIANCISTGNTRLSAQQLCRFASRVAATIVPISCVRNEETSKQRFRCENTPLDRSHSRYCLLWSCQDKNISEEGR